MLNADIEIQKIDYEKSVKNLLGRIMPKLKDKPEAWRFVFCRSWAMRRLTYSAI